MPNQNELLELLNRFTKREHTLDEVYLFDLILCDNEIDRDGDCFSVHALEQLRDRFAGVTGIFDHNPRSGNQTARIFRTELCSDPNRKTQTGQVYHFLRANAYMVRTDSNADLIREIDAGIKKEVSISCAVGTQTCSVCGCNKLKKPCAHIKGRSYCGAKCYHTLDDVTDVYEWSFVAVPAQRSAGVTKTCGGAGDPEKDAMRAELDAAGQLLDRMTEMLRREVVRLCYRGGENACAKALADAAVHMDADALLALRDTLHAAPAAADAPAQLAQSRDDSQPQMHAFRLSPR